MGAMSRLEARPTRLALVVLLAAAASCGADSGADADDGSSTVIAPTFAGTSHAVLAKVGHDLAVAAAELPVNPR